jgi:SOS-response transcriptional repressor LexA
MHQAAQRLYQAAQALRDISGQSAVARALNESPQTVKNWETRGVSKAGALKAEELLGIRAAWVLKGEGEMSARAGAAFHPNAKPIPLGMRQYPVISHVQAGALKEIAVPYGPGDGFDVEYGDDDASQWSFFLEIEGDSMLPDFRPGDRVLIDPDVSPNPGDFVAARNTKQEATFKKYRVRGIDESGQEVFELVPLNDDYPVLRSDERHLVVIGTMIEHRRKFRRK